uniref:Tyr recombinase domain-containing protein n=1 Tax=Amphimedon queenslandica TaxID=400682 RepID=A0A1X7VRX6_AMPQE
MVSSPTVITSRLGTPTTKAGHDNRVSSDNAPTSRVEHLRERLNEQGLSSQATELILSSRRTKTNKSYDSLFGRWNHWCTKQGSNPFSGPVSEVANFLATLYQEGYQYNSINAYRSAILSVHEKVDELPVGQDPIITRLVKGVFNVRPPIPRYSNTWDVQRVLNYQGKETPLSLKALTLKTAFLLAITRPSRSADLSQLNTARIRRGMNGVSFLPSVLAKQSRQGKPIEPFYFPAFQANTTLCPVNTLDTYLDKTKQMRGNENRLFISFIEPHKAVTSSSIARWLRTNLEEAGIDSSIFGAHSTRGASASTAARGGVTLKEILKAANWNSESVF